MNITCPRCGFSRELPADRLPAKSVIATCPHCACRFRLTPGSGQFEVLPDQGQAPPVERQGRPAAGDSALGGQAADGRGSAGMEDDPLPPGAVVPGRAREDSAGSASPDRSVRASAAPQEDAAAEEAAASGDEAGQNSASRAAPPGRRAAELPGLEKLPRPEGREARNLPSSPAEANPWEQAPEPDGWLAAFYQTCMRVMFGAHNFFAHLKPGVPQMRPLAFYLVISVVQVVLERAWSGMFLSLMAPSAATDPQLERMLTMLSPQLSMPMTLLLKTGVSVIQLYVLSALMHFTYGFVVGKRPDFSLLFQVTAYASAPALLCVVPLLGSLAGFVWTFACVLVGCRAALNLTWPQTLMGFAPVVFLLTPLVLQILQTLQQ